LADHLHRFTQPARAQNVAAQIGIFPSNLLAGSMPVKKDPKTW
jgi:hypothetical protein